MTAERLDGKRIALEIREEIAIEVEKSVSRHVSGMVLVDFSRLENRSRFRALSGLTPLTLWI